MAAPRRDRGPAMTEVGDKGSLGRGLAVTPPGLSTASAPVGKRRWLD